MIVVYRKLYNAAVTFLALWLGTDSANSALGPEHVGISWKIDSELIQALCVLPLSAFWRLAPHLEL